ncbi:CCR4-NOT transcription complex subunit 10 [Tetrabaena socialis]|uniref:CCR4-NOT transcription complex subunit 10 n=1 Tax=Tetrabaena socialis TaxID=47790 RepID=A0A2J8A6E5_9CHLO|nr:CCR4-NOT transcription complex subunit 10 [Tetrabaena socialis]|eukprot:PNH08067.1 CCR4-NOT transcription complex subunit 10 [Tetrabaena socialis]
MNNNLESSAATESTVLWLAHNLNDCLSTLQKLDAESKADLKLTHNILVVEHALHDGEEADRIQAQLESLANERVVAEDGAAADVGAASARPRSSGATEPLPLVPVRDDLAVAQLNMATLLYHQHSYGPAATLLEQLAANVEALAEGTAVRVLTLLLDIYIEARQLPQAVAVLQSFERLYGTLSEAFTADRAPGGEPGSCARQPAEGEAPSAGGAAAEEAVASTAGRGGAPAQVCGGAGGRPRALALPRVSRWCNDPMARSKALLDQQGCPPAVPDLKLLIKLYRSRLHALAHNTRAAKRELKAAMQQAHSAAACGEEGGKGRDAQRQEQEQQRAAASSTAASHGGHAASAAVAVPTPAVMYNAGLQHLLLQNFAAARQCFSEAAPHYVNTPLLWLRVAEAALGLYRQKQQQTAAAVLHADQGLPRTGALDSSQAVELQPRRVVLATGAHSPSEVGPAASALLSEAVVALQTALQQLDAQQAAHDQWQSSSSKLDEGLSFTAPLSGSGASASSSTAAGAAADLYLPLPPHVHALEQQLPSPSPSQRPAMPRGEDEARGNHAHGQGNGVHEPHGTDASAALSEELVSVRRAVLANLAYAQLQAEDWRGALLAAQELLAATSAAGGGLGAEAAHAGPSGAAAAAAALSGASASAEYAFLANSYAAEALCHLDRPGEAVECLSLWLMQVQEAQAQHAQSSQDPARSSSSQKSDEEGGPREVYPLGNAAALAALAGPATLAATYTNLGAVFASQGDLAQAATLVRQALSLQPSSRSAHLLLVYCELAAGNSAVALALLQRHV